MKAIKFQQRLIFYSICICFSAFLFAGCKKIFGLKLQENEEHITSTIDPHLYKSAWQYLKERALGSVETPNDTIFKRMYQGIIYSGIDTNEYLQPNRTFIFLHNDAILRKSGSTTTTDCYFGKYKVGSPPVAATKWEDYPQLQVKNYLLSLIAEGEYSFENLTPDVDSAKTLMPAGYDPLNPQSLITFNVINDRDSRLRINGFPGSALFTTAVVSGVTVITYGLQARTAGLLSTNGPIHVIERVLFFQKQ
jgi:hypothetical protein